MKKTILGITLLVACLTSNAQVKNYNVTLNEQQWSAIIYTLDNTCPDAKQGDIKIIKDWILKPITAQQELEKQALDSTKPKTIIPIKKIK